MRKLPLEIITDLCSVYGKKLELICLYCGFSLSIQNMNVEEALAVMYNIKGKDKSDAFQIYEMLKEALDYAAKDVEFPMNMHVAECFSVMYDIHVYPAGLSMEKV